jgi:hypothetical protein
MRAEENELHHSVTRFSTNQHRAWLDVTIPVIFQSPVSALPCYLSASALFRLVSYGRHERACLKQLRAILTLVKILVGFLLHCEPEEPFTGLKLNNRLSDNF